MNVLRLLAWLLGSLSAGMAFVALVYYATKRGRYLRHVSAAALAWCLVVGVLLERLMHGTFGDVPLTLLAACAGFALMIYAMQRLIRKV